MTHDTACRNHSLSAHAHQETFVQGKEGGGRPPKPRGLYRGVLLIEELRIERGATL